MKLYKLEQEGHKIEPTFKGLAEYFEASPDDMSLEWWNGNVWLVLHNGVIVGVTKGGLE